MKYLPSGLENKIPKTSYWQKCDFGVIPAYFSTFQHSDVFNLFQVYLLFVIFLFKCGFMYCTYEAVTSQAVRGHVILRILRFYFRLVSIPLLITIFVIITTLNTFQNYY